MKTLIVAALAVACMMTTAQAEENLQAQTCGKIIGNIGLLRGQQRQMQKNWVKVWDEPDDTPFNTMVQQRKALNASQMVLALGQEIAMYRDMFKENGCGSIQSALNSENDILLPPFMFDN